MASPPSALEGASKGPNRLSATSAAGVTLITVDAVVDIPVHIRVLEISRIIAAMTARALEHGVVIRVDVAGGTYVAGASVVR